jgi:hypothetical protein
VEGRGRRKGEGCVWVRGGGIAIVAPGRRRKDLVRLDPLKNFKVSILVSSAPAGGLAAWWTQNVEKNVDVLGVSLTPSTSNVR